MDTKNENCNQHKTSKRIHIIVKLFSLYIFCKKIDHLSFFKNELKICIETKKIDTHIVWHIIMNQKLSL